MKIIIMLNEQYPYGMAATNRSHLYARGLVEWGNEVTILIPRATEKPGKARNTEKAGIYCGVHFRYAFEPVLRKRFAGRRFQEIVSLINIISFLVSERPDIVIIVSNALKDSLIAKLCSLFTGSKLVREKTEVPYYRTDELTRYQKTRIRSEFRLYNGLIVISESLKHFFIDEMKLRKRILIVPILIDSSASAVSAGAHAGISPSLVYTGSLLDHKDGIFTIIRAFDRIRRKHPAVKLILTGDINSSSDREGIMSLIRKLDLDGRVEIAGYVSREELARITANASALLLAKPGNRQNKYNMATKIGEYLLSGRPAVVSSVDPACRYLEHRRNAFITAPDDNSMAGEIEYILANASEADAVGKAGKDSVLELFDYRKHAKKMVDFFNELTGKSL